MTEKKVEIVFEQDVMEMIKVKSHWKPEDLLAREGLFLLKDIVKVLELEPFRVKKEALRLEEQGLSAWDVMGARKVWNHWVVRMKVFGPYYRGNLMPRIRKIPTGLDGNSLLREKGLFYLSDVCRLIPFTTHQIRYQAKRNPNAKGELGVWKDEEANAFVVDMESFAPWIQQLWKRDFGRG